MHLRGREQHEIGAARARNCLRHVAFVSRARLLTCNLGEVAWNFNLRCAPSLAVSTYSAIHREENILPTFSDVS